MKMFLKYMCSLWRICTLCYQQIYDSA